MVVRIRALIESHDNICAQVFLDLDGFFGRKAMSGAIDMALEGHAIVVYLPGFSQ